MGTVDSGFGSEMQTRFRAAWVWVTLGLVAAGLHWKLPTSGLRASAWDLIGVASVVAAWVGIRWNRPEHPRPWYLLATGVTMFVAGDITWDVSVEVFGHADDYVPLSDLFYLCAYPFLSLGLVGLARRRHLTREALLDGSVVALVLAAPLWQLVVRPTIDGAKGAQLEAIPNLLYPIFDIVLVLLVVYTVFTLPRWNAAGWLLVLGLLVNTVGDIVYARLSATGIAADSLWLNPMWPASYVLIAGSMLHPTMRALTRRSQSRDRLDRARIFVLAAALFAIPGMLAVQLETGEQLGGQILAVSAVIISVLLAWRLIWLVRELDRSHDRVSRSEERFRALLEHASDAVCVSDVRGHPLYVSGPAEELLGRPVSEVIGENGFDYLHPDDRAEAEAMFGEVLSTLGCSLSVVSRVRHDDGTWRWIESTSSNALDEPSVGGIVTNFRDVTEQHRASAIEAGATRALEMIAQGAPLDDTLRDLLGVVERELGGARCRLEMLDPAQEGVVHRIETAAPDPSDTLAEHWVVPVTGKDERPLGRLVVLDDVDRSPGDADVALVERTAALAAVAIDRAAAEDRLEHQAFHDPLTGLPNRTLLLDRLGQALLRVDQGTVAVMFLDLDRFKVINDSLGHDAGDELLLEVSRRLGHKLKAADTVARFGGDEFVVVCERVTGISDARAIADRLAAAFVQPFTLSRGGRVTATASIGIALARSANDAPEALLRDADAAMYRAKEHGRSRIEVFDAALRSHVVVRLETERSLRRAIEREELRLRYQPVVSLDTGDVLGAEALIRWRHPTRGLIPPSQFIDIAEETGLVVPMGEWVLGQVVDELTRLHLDPRARRFVIAVNLSGRQLAQRDLVDRMRGHLETAGLDPSRLCLEVTESVLLDDVEASVSALTALKDLGLRLAVDDFGTGYSSLGYLKQFPFDLLKVDQAFTAGLGASDADDAIVLATVQMAHALGMRVTAEGVETEVQRARARELGCDYGQGYLFAAPQPANDIFGDAQVHLRVVT